MQIKARQPSLELTEIDALVLNNTLLDMTLSGTDLPTPDKDRVTHINKRLQALKLQFASNVAKSTYDWSLHITQEDMLDGLPENIKQGARLAAQSQQKSGWLLSLELNCYQAVMRFASSESLRKRLYDAFTTRASDSAQHNPAYNNTPVILETLSLRRELANLLGFEDYIQLSLLNKMPSDKQQVYRFIDTLLTHLRPSVTRDIAKVKAFAANTLNIDLIQPWDFDFCAEQYRLKVLKTDTKSIRRFLPEYRVFDSLFKLASQLFNIKIEPDKQALAWHPDVKLFRVYSSEGSPLGSFYADIYTRTGKKGGAWMGWCKTRHLNTQGGIELPVALLNCNVPAPCDSGHALLNLENVISVFHEFGHVLHHILTRIDAPSVSGLNGVAWDYSEMPSQLMEYWVLDADFLHAMSADYATGEKFTLDQCRAQIHAHQWLENLLVYRKLKRSLLDMKLHDLQFHSAEELNAVVSKLLSYEEIQLPGSEEHFHCVFVHLFASEYGAGFYSYLWAKTMAKDIFDQLFHNKQDNLSEPGQDFKSEVLEVGATVSPRVQFINLTGANPTLNALLSEYHVHLTTPERLY